ncbi:MAG: hypothetical protein ACLQF0_09160 [Dissulfurispiraceae bacterium]
MTKTSDKFIICVGYLAEGLRFCGPFTDKESATAFYLFMHRSAFHFLNICSLEYPDRRKGCHDGDYIAVVGCPEAGYRFFGPFAESAHIGEWFDQSGFPGCQNVKLITPTAFEKAVELAYKVTWENMTYVADDIVFALADYKRGRAIKKKGAIISGINACDAILRGRQVNPEKMIIEELPDLDLYRFVVGDGNGDLSMKDCCLKIDDLPQKAKEVKVALTVIQDGGKIGPDEIEDIQNFFYIVGHTPAYRRKFADREQHVL